MIIMIKNGNKNDNENDNKKKMISIGNKTISSAIWC